MKVKSSSLKWKPVSEEVLNLGLLLMYVKGLVLVRHMTGLKLMNRETDPTSHDWWVSLMVLVPLNLPVR